MKYCISCLYPATKPDLWFNDQGLCSACIAFNERKNIDWVQREKEFRELVNYYKSMKFTYDCIVPVSGGKDSHYQILKCLEYDLKILAVTATTCDLTPIGRRNLDNIAKLGVDHIEITPDKQLRKQINKFALMEIGDISWPEHVLIFTVPIIVSIKLDIPFIVWGESPQNEYGGPKGRQGEHILNKQWLQEFGGLNGLRVSDLPFDQDKLDLYRYPIIWKNDPTGIFLGHYHPWDGYNNAVKALKYGFEWNDFSVEGCGFNYENLDNAMTGIHDFFKFIKYGFGRATDLVNNHIRRGNITREEGKQHILQWDGQYPWRYLGKDLGKILNDIEMTKKEFDDCCHNFMNKDIFELKNNMPVRKYDLDLRNA